MIGGRLSGAIGERRGSVFCRCQHQRAWGDLESIRIPFHLRLYVIGLQAQQFALFWCISAVGTTVGTTVGITTIATAAANVSRRSSSLIPGKIQGIFPDIAARREEGSAFDYKLVGYAKILSAPEQRIFWSLNRVWRREITSSLRLIERSPGEVMARVSNFDPMLSAT